MLFSEYYSDVMTVHTNDAVAERELRFSFSDDQFSRGARCANDVNDGATGHEFLLGGPQSFQNLGAVFL